MKKKYLIWGIIILILASLPLVVYLVKQRQDVRQRASEPTPTATPSATLTPTPAGVTLDAEEWSFLEILNAHRESLGKQKLKVSLKLTKAATWMSEDMEANDRFDHIDSRGRGLQARLTAFEVMGNAGENIAYVGATGQSAFDAWLASTQGHKEEMEGSSAESSGRIAIGISRVKGSGNNWFWTADFGNVLDTEIVPTATPSVTEIPTATPTNPPLSCPTDTIVFHAILTKKNSGSTAPQGITKITLNPPLGYTGETYFYTMPESPINQIRIRAGSGDGPLSNPPIENPEIEKYYFTSDMVDSINSGTAKAYVTTSDYPDGELEGMIVCGESTISPSPSKSPTPTVTPTPTRTPTPTPTRTPTPTPSPTPIPTATPTLTPTATLIPTSTLTPTPTATLTPTVTVDASGSATPTTEASLIATNTPTATLAPSGSITQTLGIFGGILLVIIGGILLLAL